MLNATTAERRSLNRGREMFTIKREYDSHSCLICGAHENVKTLSIIRNSRARDIVISFGICNECLQQAGESISLELDRSGKARKCKRFYPDSDGVCIFTEACNCGQR